MRRGYEPVAGTRSDDPTTSWCRERGRHTENGGPTEEAYWGLRRHHLVDQLAQYMSSRESSEMAAIVMGRIRFEARSREGIVHLVM